jgi:hypothetical protein
MDALKELGLSNSVPKNEESLDEIQLQICDIKMHQRPVLVQEVGKNQLK